MSATYTAVTTTTMAVLAAIDQSSPLVPVQVAIDDTGKSKRYAEQICDPDLWVRDSKHDANLLVIS